MKFKKVVSAFLAIPFALVFSMNTNAAIITVTLGNDTGLTDGTSYDLFPTIALAQAGQPAPFDQGYGNELFDNPVALNWLFNYAAITETILSATLTIGLFDIDTSSPGSQLDAFSINGADTTVLLDALFEAANSGDNVYNEFTINLGAGFFAALQSGAFGASLDVGGTGLQTNLLLGGTSMTPNNGFHLLFSTLEITTQDAGGPGPNPTVPEPGTLGLFGIAVLGLLRKFRVKS